MEITTKKKAKTVPAFTITLTIDNDTYSGSGATALEALSAVKTPEYITAGELVIYKDGVEKRRAFFPSVQMKRIFSVYSREVLIHELMAGI